jgi:hypothetical protein
MNSFISTIFINTNSVSSEKIAAAIIIATPEKVWYKFATHKIDFAEKIIINSHIKKHLQVCFKLIENKVKEVNELMENGKSQLLPFESIFNENYFNYLSKYSNGLLSFEKPKSIAGKINPNTFIKLYSLYTGDIIIAKKGNKQVNFHQSVNEKLKNPSLIEKADVDLKILPSKLDGIYTPVQVKLATKNGIIQAYQDIDFTTSPETIAKHLYEWEVLTDALNSYSYKKNLKKGVYKIIFNKPEPKSEQESILNKIHKNTIKFGLTEFNEIDLVINEILTKEHIKLSTILG